MTQAETGSSNCAIDGVAVIPLERFPDERGSVYHMLKVTDPHFSGFGEIYFSSVNCGVVKAWKAHRDITANYACIFGELKLVLYDGRENSRTNGGVREIFLGGKNYSLVVVPPGVWNGFQGLTDPFAILANCATGPHDPAEFHRLDPATPQIPYNW